MWSTWWLGDGVGAVVVTPLVLLRWENPRLGWTGRQTIEVALLFLGLCSTAWVVFGGRFHSALKNYPFEYLCIPFLIWATFRFGRRKATTAVCALAVIATWGTLRGFGPFARESHNRSEEHTSELQSHLNLVCRLLLEKKKNFRPCDHHRCTHQLVSEHSHTFSD